MIPGIGIGVGFGGVGQVSPAALANYAQAILGSKLTALAAGDDIVATGSVLTSWAPRVGAALNYPDGNRFAVDVLNGRRCLSSTAGSLANLVSTQATHADEVWVVAQATVASPTDYRCAAMAILTPSASAQRALLHQSGAASWYAPGATAWYRDGAANNAIDTSPHVYSSINAASAEASIIYLGNDAGALATRSWAGKIGVFASTNGAITAGQRADFTALLRRYYRI